MKVYYYYIAGDDVFARVEGDPNVIPESIQYQRFRVWSSDVVYAYSELYLTTTISSIRQLKKYIDGYKGRIDITKVSEKQFLRDVAYDVVGMPSSLCIDVAFNEAGLEGTVIFDKHQVVDRMRDPAIGRCGKGMIFRQKTPDGVLIVRSGPVL